VTLFNRNSLLDKLRSGPAEWDIAIIGGGATGLGTAVDAASRGYSTLLVEKHDFAKGTSSRSTKLVHGGVRYLQQGNIKLVMEALRERGLLRKNAAHLVKDQSFIVPNYKWWEGSYYGLGLKVYDWMSGSLGLGPSEWLSTEQVLEHAPTLAAEGLKGGVLYHDGQFDDARLAVNLAQTAIEHGAVVLNHMQVTALLKTNGQTWGFRLCDNVSSQELEIKAKVVINATGVFSDAIQQLDDSSHSATIVPSQGIHLVFDREFLPGDAAIMIPHTDDGRVLFAVPWHNRIITGTTDTPVTSILEEPAPLESEVEFVLEHVSRYFSKEPRLEDVRSMFAGLRPLVKSTAKRTAEISRDHSIVVSSSGLISILGGKWTTYRKMSEDVVDLAVKRSGMAWVNCKTKELSIHGNQQPSNEENTDYYYGTDSEIVRNLCRDNNEFDVQLHPRLPYKVADVVHAVRNELAVTVEDVLSRRTRALLLDAEAAIAMAPAVAKWMANELSETEDWQSAQVSAFIRIARQYLPANP
jgi:glycerol-3-phosphate dehydrogenase